MKWLEDLENWNTSFKIHVLQKHDCILISHKTNSNQSLYILDGLIEITQIFTNKEKICIELLFKNDIFIKQKSNYIDKVNYYYKIVAIKKTAIVNISSKRFANINQKPEFLYTYNINIEKNNHKMAQILSHKNTKKRVVQLLLILAKNFGRFNKNNITIPFYISHQIIGSITGSQRANISRIMNYLKKNKMIYYDKQKIVLYNIIKLVEI